MITSNFRLLFSCKYFFSRRMSFSAPRCERMVNLSRTSSSSLIPIADATRCRRQESVSRCSSLSTRSTRDAVHSCPHHVPPVTRARVSCMTSHDFPVLGAATMFMISSRRSKPSISGSFMLRYSRSSSLAVRNCREGGSSFFACSPSSALRSTAVR